MYKTYDNNLFGISILLMDIQKECEQNKQPRIRIITEFFDDHCKSCGKQLELSKEFEYAGQTRCLECKLSDEEFDDEMS